MLAVHSIVSSATILSLSRARMPEYMYQSGYKSALSQCLSVILVTRFSFIINVLISAANTMKIEKLVIPDVVQSNSSAVLDCQYSIHDDLFTMEWFFNDCLVYQWKPRTEPVVSGVLDGRLDSTYRASLSPLEERRALRIVAVDPELSGKYTCRVASKSVETRLTKTMLVYSTEREFVIHFDRRHYEMTVKCYARGLYPQPELTIECNGVPFPRQQQRVWLKDALYDAESTTNIAIKSIKPVYVTCRLQLPQAGYTAIKKELLYADERDHGSTYARSKRLTTCPTCMVALAVFVLSISLYQD